MAEVIANREVCEAVVKDYATQRPLLYINFANVTTTEITSEIVYAYGGWQHGKKVAFTGEKGGTIAFECQVQPFQMFSLMSGAAITNTAEFVIREELTAVGGIIELSKTPVGGRVDVCPKAADCETFETVSVSGKNVTITGATTGTYVAYYEAAYTNNTRKISIKSTVFPGMLTIEAKTLYRSENGVTIPMMYKVYKCQPQTNFTLTNSNSGDPGTLTFTCDLMVDAEDRLIDMIEILDSSDTAAAFNVTYHVGAGAGTAPIDATDYGVGDTVTVKFTTSSITPPSGQTFSGWSLTPYAATATYTSDGTTTFVMGTEDVTLYAVYA